MILIHRGLALALLALALLVLAVLSPAPTAQAEQFRTVPGYEIHYNAFRADTVPAEVAKVHGITRSASRGLINVTVLGRNADGATSPSEAAVSGTVTNLAGQTQTLRLRAIREPGALYYIGEFRIAGEDTYRFKLTVQPANSARSESIQFSQPLVAE